MFGESVGKLNCEGAVLTQERHPFAYLTPKTRNPAAGTAGRCSRRSEKVSALRLPISAIGGLLSRLKALCHRHLSVCRHEIWIRKVRRLRRCSPPWLVGALSPQSIFVQPAQGFLFALDHSRPDGVKASCGSQSSEGAHGGLSSPLRYSSDQIDGSAVAPVPWAMSRSRSSSSWSIWWTGVREGWNPPSNGCK